MREDRRIICVTRDKCTIMKNRNIDNRKKEGRGEKHNMEVE